MDHADMIYGRKWTPSNSFAIGIELAPAGTRRELAAFVELRAARQGSRKAGSGPCVALRASSDAVSAAE